MTLIPAKKNYTIWQGATFRERIEVYEDIDQTQPRDFTGFSAELIIRSKIRGPELFTLSTENGRIILGDGLITLVVTDEDTADLEWKQGVYDLTVTTLSGDTDAYLKGLFKVVGV